VVGVGAQRHRPCYLQQGVSDDDIPRKVRNWGFGHSLRTLQPSPSSGDGAPAQSRSTSIHDYDHIHRNKAHHNTRSARPVSMSLCLRHVTSYLNVHKFWPRFHRNIFPDFSLNSARNSIQKSPLRTAENCWFHYRLHGNFMLLTDFKLNSSISVIHKHHVMRKYFCRHKYFLQETRQ
jgi:hypothetical protein